MESQGRIIEINNYEEYQKAVLVPNKAIIVDFWSQRCPPCIQLGQQIPQLIKSSNGWDIVKVNIDNNENRGIYQNFGVKSIPFIAYYEDTKKVDQATGASRFQEFMSRASSFMNNNDPKLKENAVLLQSVFEGDIQTYLDYIIQNGLQKSDSDEIIEKYTLYLEKKDNLEQFFKNLTIEDKSLKVEQMDNQQKITYYLNQMLNVNPMEETDKVYDTLQMIYKILNNIKNKPDEDKFKKVKKDNKKIEEVIGKIFGAESLLKELGFTITDTEYIFSSQDLEQLAKHVEYIKKMADLMK